MPSPLKAALLVLAGLCLGVSRAGALYDPKPMPALAACEGAWVGTLEYKDYSQPDRRVTLPTRLSATLAASNALALHYVFDDGPGKVVHSYERLEINLDARSVTWSGTTPSDTQVCTLESSEETGGGLVVVALWRNPAKPGSFERYRIALGEDAIEISKEDGGDPAALSFRDRYVFRRPQAPRG